MPRPRDWTERIAAADWAGWARAASGFLHQVQQATEQAQQAQGAAEVMQQVAQWGTLLAKNASDKWVMFAADPRPCRFRMKPGERCSFKAMSLCDVCGDPVCLAHSRVDFIGNAICFRCVREARRSKGPVVPENIVAALKLFKLKKSAMWEEVALAYRKAVLRHHSDRAVDDKDRARREAKMKEINAAHDLLKKHYDTQKDEAA